jgi:hypothetical protein
MENNSKNNKLEISEDNNDNINFTKNRKFFNSKKISKNEDKKLFKNLPLKDEVNDIFTDVDILKKELIYSPKVISRKFSQSESPEQ